MAIYSGFTHWKWWFSIVMLVYQRVPGCASHLVKGVWSIYCTGASINGDTPIAGWFIVDNSFKMDDLPPPILGNLQSVQPRHGSVTYIYILWYNPSATFLSGDAHPLSMHESLFAILRGWTSGHKNPGFTQRVRMAKQFPREVRDCEENKVKRLDG